MSSLFDSLTKADSLLEDANRLFNAGRFKEAKSIYQAAYTLRPDWMTAYGMGLAFAALKEEDSALYFYRECVIRNPEMLEVRINIGNILYEKGQKEEADHHFLIAYGLQPTHPLTLYNIGSHYLREGEGRFAHFFFEECLRQKSDFHQARHVLAGLPSFPALSPEEALSPQDQALYEKALVYDQEGRKEEAIALLQEVVAQGRANAIMLVDFGNLHLHLQRVEEARAFQEQALKKSPFLVTAHHNLGAVFQALNLLKEAYASYYKALSLAPSLTASWMNMGRVLAAQGRFGEAWDCFYQAGKKDPTCVEAFIERAALARGLQRVEDAVAATRRIYELRPDDYAAVNNLGSLLLDQGALDEALACFEKGVALNEEAAVCHFNRGAIFQIRGAYDEAWHAYQKALELDPGNINILARIIHVGQHQCIWDNAAELFKSLHETFEKGEIRGINPFGILSIPEINRFDQLKCSRQFAEESYGSLKALKLPKPLKIHQAKTKATKIKIGYLSSDFYDHATAWLLAEVIEWHDRSRFEVVAYSYGPTYETSTRQRLKQSFDRFVDISALSDERAALQIRSDEIDILVDLKGYTQNTRSGILALEPSPVQVNYLGFPGTLGASYVSHIIADAVVIPPEYEDSYSEKVLRLPHCYQPNDRKRPLPPPVSRAEAGLPEKGFVFCSFNNVFKITPDVYDLWCQLLKEVPGSLLWILSSNLTANAHLVKEAEKRGVEASRVFFAPRRSLPDHLARFRCADLFLDTFPCTAHTTASDSLWVGVPVVTRLGETFASRVAASILTAAGLPELVTETPEAYYACAKDLALNPDRLAHFKDILETHRLTCPLFDSQSYTQALEKLYQEAYEAWFYEPS